MQHIKSLFVTLLIISSLSGLASKKILIIHSYHPGLEWTDSLTKGINDGLKEHEERYDLFFEYLDSKRFEQETYFEYFGNILKLKLSKKKYDIIIGCDDNSYNFIKEHNDFFPSNQKFVFCGLNQLNENSKPIKNYFFIRETLALNETIDLMIKLHPDRKNILAIHDHTTTGNIIKSLIEKNFNKYEDRVNIISYTNIVIDELKTKLNNLDDSYMVLLLGFNRDISENYYSYNEAIKIVSNNTQQPIYGTWSFFVNHGLTGGVITSGYQQGLAAGRVTNRVIKNDTLSILPIQKIEPETILDFGKLMSFQVITKNIPEKSTLINKPEGFYYANRKQIFNTIFITLLLSTIVYIVRYQIIRKKNKELDLIIDDKSNQIALIKNRYQLIFDYTTVGIIVTENNQKITEINPRCLEIFGFRNFTTENEKNILNNLTSSIPKHVLNNIQNETSQTIEFKLKDKWCLCNITSVNYDTHNSNIFVIDDISDIKQTEQMKSDMNNILHQDLKRPLGDIIECVRNLKQANDFIDKNKINISNIEKKSKQLLTDINLSIDIYKMEQGLYKCFMDKADIIETVKIAVLDNEDIIKDKNITIEYNYNNAPLKPSDYMIFEFDRLLTYSMVGNIIRNGILSSPENGKVTAGFYSNSHNKIIFTNELVLDENRKDEILKKSSKIINGVSNVEMYTAKLIAETQGGKLLFKAWDSGSSVTLEFKKNRETY